MPRPDARSESRPKSASPWTSLLHFAFGTRLPLEHETALFILVSLLDLLVTAWLIHAGYVRESNRVAAAVLRHWGLRGLLTFKFVMVACICVVVQIVARRRPRTARWILLGATVLVTAVVVHAVLLGAKAGGLLGS